MRAYNLSPLFRSTVGFDRFADLLDLALKSDEQGGGYPPYNIEKLGEDSYRVTMAVAGFGPGDLEIVARENALTVTGKANKPAGTGADGAPAQPTFLHRGIAGRAFEKHFQLADHIRVAGASLENGLLHIELVREVPEALKPRQIPITAPAPRAILPTAA